MSIPVSDIDLRYTPACTNGVTLTCRTCNQTKPIVEFAKASSNKNGYRAKCLICVRAYNKMRYDACDKTARRESLRRWQDANRDYVNAYARKQRNVNEPFVPKGRQLRYTHHSQANAKSNAHYHANKAHFHEYNRKRNQRSDVKAKRAAQALRLLRENEQYRIKQLLSKRIRAAIKSAPKAAHTLELLGCDLTLFRSWMEHQFWNGMSWHNHSYRGWHIDHIRPCASFNLTDPEQQKQCFHWTNLQPLWGKDNTSKRDDIWPTIDYQI